MSDMPWYFAYGANLARSIFVGRRGIRPGATRRARMDGYRLAFTEPGIPIFEPSFANLEPSPGDTVHGVAYSIAGDELDALARDESSNYIRLDVTAFADDGEGLSCVAFQSRRTIPDRPPSYRYRQLLIDGAREHDLPAEYIEFLLSQPCVDGGIGRALNGAFYHSYVRLRRLGIRHENHLDTLERIDAFLQRFRR